MLHTPLVNNLTNGISEWSWSSILICLFAGVSVKNELLLICPSTATP